VTTRAQEAAALAAQQAAMAQAAQAAPAVPAPPAPQFALSPALLNNDPIDYSTSAGSKLFKSNIEAFPTKFDSEPKNLRLFLESVSDRAAIANWSAVLTIPDSTNVPRNLVTEFGMLSLDNVRAHAQTYMGTQSRNDQNAAQMYECLSTSLTPEAHNKVLGLAASYKIGGRKNGPAFLKAIIMTAHTDTRASSSHIRRSLTCLDSYMSTVNSDIEKFNQYVRLQLTDLAARGETTTDIVVNLFKGYLAASDTLFLEYIRQKQNAYEEGIDMTYQDLMLNAENRYKALKLQGTWSAPTKNDEQIIALTAQMATHSGKIDTLAKQAHKPKEDKNGKRRRGKGKGKGKDKGDKQGRKLPKWRTDPPKPGQSRKKTVNGVEWTWCEHHNAYGQHEPADCRKAQEQKQAPQSSESAKSQATLQLAKSLASIIEEDGQDYN
jgi:hypothetical protein